jgi:hypothetical protein
MANDHYVPRFYLRQFALPSNREGIKKKGQPRQIGLYVLSTQRYQVPATIGDEASQEHFYEDPVAEKIITDVEQRSAKVVARVVKECWLPNWTTADDRDLIAFIALQQGRTERQAAIGRMAKAESLRQIAVTHPETAQHIAAALDHPPPITSVMLRIAIKGLPICQDLRSKLICNRTSSPFITSDHPVVFYNQFYESVGRSFSTAGMATRGLQLFTPLSPSLLLLLYDADVYRIGTESIGTPCVDLTSPVDVDALNMLQVLNAGTKLFFSTGVSREYLLRIIGAAEPFKVAPVKSLPYKPAVVDGQEHGAISPVFLNRPQVNLALSSINIKFSASKYNSDEVTLKYRNPVLYMQMSTPPRSRWPKPLRGRVLKQYGKRRSLDNSGEKEQA